MAEYETRAVSVPPVVDGSRIRGTAIVFNSRSVDMGFYEYIRPHAVDRLFAGGPVDVRALVDHDSAHVIGRTTNGTLALSRTSAGLVVDIAPPDTSAGRDIVTLLRRGDVDGMSFGFKVLKDRWFTEDGKDAREIEDLELREVSIVTFPAYPETSVALRSRDAARAARAGGSVALLSRRLRLV